MKRIYQSFINMEGVWYPETDKTVLTFGTDSIIYIL